MGPPSSPSDFLAKAGKPREITGTPEVTSFFFSFFAGKTNTGDPSLPGAWPASFVKDTSQKPAQRGFAKSAGLWVTFGLASNVSLRDPAKIDRDLPMVVECGLPTCNIQVAHTAPQVPVFKMGHPALPIATFPGQEYMGAGGKDKATISHLTPAPPPNL